MKFVNILLPFICTNTLGAKKTAEFFLARQLEILFHSPPTTVISSPLEIGTVLNL